ncbi:effector-associated constant component EACC1 [Streptomyces misionensis]|uniref:effector-associated constant component EACC1 n=1 Tax=Streptomyces misionensis TaxID=67331 RepID=UPI00340328C0
MNTSALVGAISLGGFLLSTIPVLVKFLTNRRSSVHLRITVGDGRTIELDAKNVQQAEELVQAFIASVSGEEKEHESPGGEKAEKGTPEDPGDVK